MQGRGHHDWNPDLHGFGGRLGKTVRQAAETSSPNDDAAHGAARFGKLKRSFTAALAQVVERRIVVPKVVGSNPTSRPT